MHHEMRELPFITDINDCNVETYDPQQDAAYKPLALLTIDEAITFRQADFFPGDDDKRQYVLSTKIDPMFRRALWALTDVHPHTLSSNNRFVAIALGAMICNEKYYHDLLNIKQLYSIAINSDDDYLFDHADTHSSIKQQGSLKQINVGFTQRERDRVETLADELGITVSGILVVYFWAGTATSSKIDPLFTAYGSDIIYQFERHLRSRLHTLNFNAN